MPSKLQILGLPLVLAILLLTASTSQAAPVALNPAPSSLEEEFEAELGEFEESEDEGEGEEELIEGTCEEAEEEFEEGELSKAEVKEICDEEAAQNTAQNSKKAASARSAASAECILRTARGHSTVGANGRKLKLTIGYTTYEPVGVTIEVGVGSSHIATLHRHLGRSGVLRKVERLRGHEAPRRLAVDIEIPSTKKAGCPSRRLVLFPR